MSINSLHIKGLQNGKSLEANCFLSQSINSKFLKKYKLSDYSKLRMKTIYVFFALFLVFAITSHAQIGSSCTNPYKIYLTNDSGNAEFQFNNQDTVMYLKIMNLSDRAQLVISNLTSVLKLNKIIISESACNSSLIYENKVSTQADSIYGLNLNFNLDSILVTLFRPQSIMNDSFNLKIKVNPLQPLGSPVCPASALCENLVWNADFEQLAPPLPPDWPFVQYYEFVCGWAEQSFMQSSGVPLETSPEYFNAYFDQISNCPLIPCSARGLTSSSGVCGFPPQSGNNFFTGNNNGYGAQFYNIPAEILQGKLVSPLVYNHKYYIEVNYANGWSNPYAGQVQFDVSSAPNYIMSSYSGPSPEDIALTSDGVPYNPGGWAKQNTVITALGNEEFIYMGNLTQQIIAPITSGNTAPPYNNCAPGNANMPYFAFDNIVVKEFYANAGPNAITICSGETIGTTDPNYCPFPNETYNWQPANAFIDNTVLNPVCTTSVNVVCTLTVSINVNNGVPGNTVAETASATVNVTVNPSPLVVISGSNTITETTSTDLTASGADTYVWSGTNGTSGTGATFNTTALFQQETFTVTGTDANGCTSIETFVVDVEPMPLSCGNHNNTVTIFDGMTSTELYEHLDYYYPGNIYLVNAGNGTWICEITSYTAPNDINFLLAGNLVIDEVTGLKFNFTGTSVIPVNIDCFDGSSIINNGYLEMASCSLTACNNMWKGIENNGKIVLKGCYIADAENGVHLLNGSVYNINTNVFENNLYGILMGGISGGQLTGVNYSNIFHNPDALKPAYSGMYGWKPYAEAGIKLFNISFAQIGFVPDALPGNSAITVCNYFHHINAGIVSSNSNVKVVNSRFSDISPLNSSIGQPWLQHNGAGIYASSVNAPRMLTVVPIPGYTGNEFENCTYGIKTYKNSLLANSLKMDEVTYGIDAHQCMNGTYRLAENLFDNVTFAGISIGQAEAANVIKLTFNEVTLSNAVNKNKGIVITGSGTGGLSGNCYIKSNIVTAGAGALGGIFVTGMMTPELISNTVNKSMFYLSPNSSNGFSGFELNDCEEAYLNCNNTTKNNSAGTNLGSDYKISISPNGYISCNNSGASPLGFNFNGTSPGTDFRTNIMGAQKTGLYVGSSGVLGPQPSNAGYATSGNQWTGTYSSGYGARNVNTQPNAITSNQFLTKPTDGAEFNPTVSPSNWFDQSTESHVALCGSSCSLERSETFYNMDFYKAIAQSTLITTDYPVESLWMLQGSLYETLTKEPQLLMENDSLALFYYSPDMEAIQQLMEVEHTIKSIENTVKYYHLTLHGNDSLMAIKQNETEALQQSILGDTLNDTTLVNTLQLKLAQLELMLQLNKAFYDTLSAMQYDHAAGALELNNEIEPGNANEAIEKDINDVFLRTLALGNSSFSSADSSLLYTIAHLCPMAAGPSVYRARSMYALLSDTIAYQDSAVCAFEGYYRESANTMYPLLTKKENRISYFKAQPNPASEIIKFSFSPIESTATFSIYNMNGLLIFTKSLSAGVNQVTRDVNGYTNGVYIAQLIKDSGSSTIKFAVHK